MRITGCPTEAVDVDDRIGSRDDFEDAIATGAEADKEDTEEERISSSPLSTSSPCSDLRDFRLRRK